MVELGHAAPRVNCINPEKKGFIKTMMAS